jgi:hypothetical protein
MRAHPQFTYSFEEFIKILLLPLQENNDAFNWVTLFGSESLSTESRDWANKRVVQFLLNPGSYKDKELNHFISFYRSFGKREVLASLLFILVHHF